MANFGFSIGDIILVSNYAKGIYRSCKHAGEDFLAIKSDVKSLQSHLDAFNDELEKPESSVNKQSSARLKEIEALLQGCRQDLQELDQILSRYKFLRTTDPRARDRVRFTSRKQADIRAKIVGHSNRLQQMLVSVNTVTLTRIEGNTEHQALSLAQLKAKLDEIHQDVLNGKRDPSILTDIHEWNAVEEEILYDTVTETDMDIRSEIDTWLEKIRKENDIGSLMASIHAQETRSEVTTTDLMTESEDEGTAARATHSTLANISSSDSSEGHDLCARVLERIGRDRLIRSEPSDKRPVPKRYVKAESTGN